MIKKALKQGSNLFEWTHKRYKGDNFYATVLLTRMKIGGQVLLQATVRDVTKHKEAELKIQEQIYRLKEMDELKSHFLSAVSHELRTPITPIKSQTQRMLDINLSKEGRIKSLEMVLRNTIRLDRLIQDILEISRIKAGKLKIFRKSDDINSIIEESKGIMKPISDERKVKIKLRLNKVPKIPVDRDRILEVLTNLIDNAIIYGGRKDILISSKVKGSLVIVEVKDKGRGILKKNLSQLFEPFYREKRSWEDQIQGTGLGLSICKGIVESHGGEMSVKSVLNKGSVFYFTLPLKKKSLIRKKTEVIR